MSAVEAGGDSGIRGCIFNILDLESSGDLPAALPLLELLEVSGSL
jgi:hypothetical protein